MIVAANDVLENVQEKRDQKKNENTRNNEVLQCLGVDLWGILLGRLRKKEWLSRVAIRLHEQCHQ